MCGAHSVAHPKDTSWSWSCSSNLYQGYYCYEAVYEWFAGLSQPYFINVKPIGGKYVKSFGASDDWVGEFHGNYVILVERNPSMFGGRDKWICKGRKITGQNMVIAIKSIFKIKFVQCNIKRSVAHLSTTTKLIRIEI